MNVMRVERKGRLTAGRDVGAGTAGRDITVTRDGLSREKTGVEYSGGYDEAPECHPGNERHKGAS
ncbi:hypothetical protein GCM10027287_23970 [Bordetella muralis]